MQNGKGSKPRPIKDIPAYLSNFDEIDWTKKNEKSTCNPQSDDVVSKHDESKSNSTSAATERQES
jgi:hypothetical protein